MPRHTLLLALLLLGACLATAIGLPREAQARSDLLEAQRAEATTTAIDWNALIEAYSGYQSPTAPYGFYGYVYVVNGTYVFINTAGETYYYDAAAGWIRQSWAWPDTGYIDPHNPPVGWHCEFNAGFDFAQWYSRCNPTGW